MNALSRRSFTHILGGAAVAAALPFPQIALAQPEMIRLSANENPYGPPPGALAAMREAFAIACRYPDDEADALASDIATMHSLSTSQIILGDGSSEILKLAAEAFVGPNRKLIVAEPTFEALALYSRATGADVVRVPLTASHAHDLAKMKEAARGAGLVYICNPNNPTATITPAPALKSFIAALPQDTMVLVDEAYHHYAIGPDYESMIPLIAKHPNLVVARTFSKIYGMAGLRCGYCVSSEATIRKLQNQQAWDSVNVMALVAARAALADTDHVAEQRKLNTATKEWVREQTDRLGFPTLRSEANFVMIDTRRDVKPLLTAMRERGVRVGRLFPAMPQHMRVTIGKPDEMKRFVAAFAAATAS